MQKYIEDNNNNEVYSIRHLSRKLSERNGVEGSKVRLTQRVGLPKAMLLEEVNSIVTDTILNSFVGEAKIVTRFLQDNQQTELTEGTDRFYPYNEFFIDITYSKP